MLVGGVGAAVLAWSLVNTRGTSNSSANPDTKVCTNQNYSFTTGCRQAAHTLSQRQAGQAYIITNVAAGGHRVDEYQIMSSRTGGGSTVIADRSITSSVPRYVLLLTDLWGSQGAKVKPGSYELITVSGATSTSYQLRIIYSPPPSSPPTSTASP